MLINTTCRLATAAHRLFPQLILMANNAAQTESYSFLNENHIRMESVNDVDMGKVLDIVSQTCAQYRLPDLAALAVNKQTGLPGARYHNRDSWQEEMNRIAAYDWSKVGRLDVTVNLRMN